LALLRLGRNFEFAKYYLENNLTICGFNSWGLSKEQREQLRPLARRNGNLEFLAYSYDNRWVAHAIRTREARKKAKTLYEKVKAHSRGDETYLRKILSKKRVSDDIKFQAKKILTRQYQREIISLTSSWNDGCGSPIEPTESALAKAKKYQDKLEQLWKGDKRFNLMPENVEDPEVRARLYEEEGNVSMALSDYHLAMIGAEGEMDVQKALKMGEKFKQMKLEHDAMKQPEKDTRGGRK
jgi:hypothetical protein